MDAVLMVAQNKWELKIAVILPTTVITTLKFTQGITLIVEQQHIKNGLTNTIIHSMTVQTAVLEEMVVTVAVMTSFLFMLGLY